MENIYQQKVAQFQSLCQTACMYGDALNRSDSNVQVVIYVNTIFSNEYSGLVMQLNYIIQSSHLLLVYMNYMLVRLTFYAGDMF